MEVLSPLRLLLDGKMGLLLNAAQTNAPEQATRVFTDLLTAYPDLVQSAVDSLDRAMRILFGEQSHEVLITGDEQPEAGDAPLGSGLHRRVTDPGTWPDFMACRPTVQDFIALGRGLLATYGVSLGNFSGSAASSGEPGTTSKPTSLVSTASTPGSRAGARRTTRAG